MRPGPFNELLIETTKACHDADQPANHADAHALFDRAADTERALDRLGDDLARDCFGAIDRFGRCADCARLLDWPRPRAHGKRGCATAIPTIVVHARWLAGYLMSLPFVGKALWHLRRRGSA